MSYDFSFDKKSAILVVVGCLAIGALLFFAGYIVGLDRGQNQTVQANSASQTGQTSKSKQQHPAEKESSANESSASTEKPSSTAAPKAAPKDVQQAPAASTAESKTPEAAGDKTQPAKDAAADKDKSTFSLQLGAFQTETNARKLRDTLRAKGYPVFLFRVQDTNGNLWNTVRMGHYADTKEASHAAAKVTSKEQISAWVRPSNAF